MPLEIKVQGEAAASRMADTVEIHIAFKSKGYHRNKASTTLFKAVETLIDTLQKLSPTLGDQSTVFQATLEGPITSWSVGTQHVQSQSIQVPKTKAYQDIHMITAPLTITVRDFQILGQLSKAITRTPCVASVDTIWSLDEPAAARLKIEVLELAAKDALDKATAIASSMGFQTVTAEGVALQDCRQTSLSTGSHFSDGNGVRPFQPRNPRHGCFVDADHSYGGASIGYSDSKWTSRDEAGNMDAWTLVLVPKEITLTATINATFSATSSAGWMYEEINQHRFLTE